MIFYPENEMIKVASFIYFPWKWKWKRSLLKKS